MFLALRSTKEACGVEVSKNREPWRLMFRFLLGHFHLRYPPAAFVKSGFNSVPQCASEQDPQAKLARGRFRPQIHPREAQATKETRAFPRSSTVDLAEGVPSVPRGSCRPKSKSSTGDAPSCLRTPPTVSSPPHRIQPSKLLISLPRHYTMCKYHFVYIC